MAAGTDANGGTNDEDNGDREVDAVDGLGMESDPADGAVNEEVDGANDSGVRVCTDG